MNAENIVDRIATCEQFMLDSLFSPVTFPDGSRGTYNGFLVSHSKGHARFTYMGKHNLLVNRAGVIGQWSKDGKGRTWYQHVLAPFGDVPFSVEVKAGNLLAEKFIK